jgi:hypothetical protein
MLPPGTSDAPLTTNATAPSICSPRFKIASGKVIPGMRPNHTSAIHQVPEQGQREVPGDLDVHVAVDKLTTHMIPSRPSMAAPTLLLRLGRYCRRHQYHIH